MNHCVQLAFFSAEQDVGCSAVEGIVIREEETSLREREGKTERERNKKTRGLSQAFTLTGNEINVWSIIALVPGGPAGDQSAIFQGAHQPPQIQAWDWCLSSAD